MSRHAGRSRGQSAFDEAAAKPGPMVWVLKWPSSQFAHPEFGKSCPQVGGLPSRQVELACMPRGRREKQKVPRDVALALVGALSPFDGVIVSLENEISERDALHEPCICGETRVGFGRLQAMSDTCCSIP